MEPQTRYVKSADGTSIAYWVLGQGRPLVLTPNVWITSMESFWQIPGVRENIERLAQRRLVVQFDCRGQGLSQREVSDLSLEARVADLAAVVNNLDAGPVDGYAVGNGALIAIAYAAANPDRVRRLVLPAPAVRGRDFRVAPEQRALSTLIQVNWKLYVQALVLDGFGWTEMGRRVAEVSMDSISSEMFVAALAGARAYDVSDCLAQIRCPTLVMHRRGFGREHLLNVAKHLAASIPNARLVQYEQTHPVSLAEEATVRLFEQFLDEDDGASTEQKLPSGTAIILFADIADSTALTERLGDAAFREKARELDSALRQAITSNGGTAIDGKLLGDGVLATFGAAREAIACAAALHDAGSHAGLSLHLGIHAGDVIRESNNVYGGAVNIAARVAGEAAAGETLVSQTVRELARTSAGVSFEDRGERALKGVGEPVRVWAVRSG